MQEPTGLYIAVNVKTPLRKLLPHVHVPRQQHILLFGNDDDMSSGHVSGLHKANPCSALSPVVCFLHDMCILLLVLRILCGAAYVM